MENTTLAESVIKKGNCLENHYLDRASSSSEELDTDRLAGYSQPSVQASGPDTSIWTRIRERLDNWHRRYKLYIISPLIYIH